MINKPPPFKGLNIRIPIIITIKGRGFINPGSTLCPYQGSQLANAATLVPMWLRLLRRTQRRPRREVQSWENHKVLGFSA